MKAADRAGLARLLEEVSARLDGAPVQTLESAERYALTDPGFNVSAFQAGGLEQICRNEAAAIRYLITAYLTQPVRSARPASSTTRPL